MPGYDGTGPEGRGRNGRGLGPCNDMGGRSDTGFFGFRRGRRGGRRGFWWANRTVESEKSAVKSEKSWLSQQLDAINRRLDSLEED